MESAFDFVRLADVETAQEVQDSDSVLIIQGNVVKKTDKKNVGGGGAGIVYFTISGSTVRNGSDWETGTDATKEDVVAAYENGVARVFYMYNGSLSDVGNVIGYRMYNGEKQPVFIKPSDGQRVTIS